MSKKSKVGPVEKEPEVILTITPDGSGQTGQYCGHCYHDLPDHAKKCYSVDCQALPPKIIKRVPESSRKLSCDIIPCGIQTILSVVA